ncbi:type IV pilin protein [Halomonas sp. H10-9-1]|uniref:type IV pilin protein n=1 Tax=Halomonas sp. H10-9-1 TaxID=2950871 RepID=UPI0032DED34D
MNPPNARRSAGFTLIEVLIAVAIIGILAAIAYPQYTAYVERSLRADAHAGLNIAAGELERCYTRTYSYSDCDITSPSPEGSYRIETPEPPPEDALENNGRSYTVVATTEREDGCDGNDGIWLSSDGTRGPEGCWP